jgi:hypothetical protein
MPRNRPIDTFAGQHFAGVETNAEPMFTGFRVGPDATPAPKPKRAKKPPPAAPVFAHEANALVIVLDLETISEGRTFGNRFAAGARAKKQHQACAAAVTQALGGDGFDLKAVEVRRQHASTRAELDNVGPEIDAMLERQERLGKPWLPCVVTLTRIAVRTLDDDNVATAMKRCRDGVAKALCVDDRHRDIVRYEYAQEVVKAKRGVPTTKALRIRIERRTAGAL